MDTKLFLQLGRIAQKYPQIPWQFLRRVNFDGPNGCWLWTGAATKTGYGHFSQRKGGRGKSTSSYLTHRIAYVFVNGPIPKGLVLDHLCETPACCNPDHLEPVTHTENIRRGQTKLGRWGTGTHCRKGHELTDDNVYIRPGRGTRVCRTCDSVHRQAFEESHVEYLRDYRKEYYQRPDVKQKQR